MSRWPVFVYSDADDSVFRMESILTSCLITRPKLFQDCMLKTSSDFSIGLLFYLINWQVHLQLAVFLHLCCSCHLTSFVLCIEHAALWEKWLITITSSAGSHSSAHSHSLPLYPSIPHCPPVLSLFLSCSTSQEINVPVKPFIYLEWSRRRKGHRKPQLPCHKYGQPAWTFSLGLVLDSDRLLLMHVGNSLYANIKLFFLVNKLLFVCSCWIWYRVECE